MRWVLITILSTASLFAQVSPTTDLDPTRVAVLGYHDFSSSAAETEMLIRTDKFRQQMGMIRQLGLNVISMQDFQAWKRGEKEIPEKSVVITIDDGWKSVYTEAFPVLKEFGYPFTLYLYKNYVDGGGKALTTEMIKEMQKHGATIGSHSVSHPYPGEVKKHRNQGPDKYDVFLRKELGESKSFLENKFGKGINTYAYPGGFHTPEMYPLAEELGYTHLFTVIPGKVSRDSPNYELPRYIVLATHDTSFSRAVNFTTAVAGSSSLIATMPPPDQPVKPAAGSLVSDRLPVISIDLSDEADLDPESLQMKIGGFGVVPAKWDESSKTLSWQINRPLRLPACEVQVNWKNKTLDEKPKPVRWGFRIEHEDAYIPLD